MKRRFRPITNEEEQFFAGFAPDKPDIKFRVRKAIWLAEQLRLFMPGLPGEVQDQLHNAAFALEQWAEKQK